MSKQTSIDWLVDQLFKQGYFDGNKPLSITNLDHLQHQAKEMYEDEMKKFAIKCQMAMYKSDSILSVEDVWDLTYKNENNFAK